MDIPDKKYSFRNSNALPKSNVKQGDFIIVIESHKTHGLHGFVVHFDKIYCSENIIYTTARVVREKLNVRSN